ncbi:MAG: 3D-(3,5/4)-trihydroxycyclohexane-1,2-dione acylhydrolase (decyclizing) [Phycisphaeraceae bacterium]|nr:3D-(3,5/4)-trihydroxycyclohexane-1,2-dione acylhydrolase (decyclizing) [Phycisphaeraceae bacterium]
MAETSANHRASSAKGADRDRTVRLTMAQAIVRFLGAQHSERDGRTQRLVPAIFGIYGHGNVAGLGQALESGGADLPYHQPCNEQGMVHMASGLAKATYRKQTLACAASIGPGSTNMLTGAATAALNRLPVLLLPADYYATRHQGPVLQQLEHPVSADVSVNDAFRPLSRFFDRLSRPEQALTALPEAMRVLTDPAETGVVTLALPQDVQSHAYDYPLSLFERREWRIERRLPHPQRIDEAVAMLKAARRPMIIAGGGVLYSEAWAELQAFAETFGIPVSETSAGKGAMCMPSPLALGGQGVTGTSTAGSICAESDLVLAIGTRLTDFTTGSQSCFNHPDVRFIGINVTGHDAFKNGALPVLADAREAITALHKAAAAAGVVVDPEYAARIDQARAAWADRLEKDVYPEVPGELMNQSQLVRAVNEAARPGDAIIAAAGSPPGDLLSLWDATDNRQCHLEFGNSCMGYEIPAAVGVRMNQPEGEVYVYLGDGGYLMNPTELVTSIQEGLKITIVLSENHGFQVIRRLQMGRGGRSFGNEFRHRDAASNRLEGAYLEIDFAKNAEAFGARAWRADTPAALAKALDEARDEPRSCVIVVETEKQKWTPDAGVWWDVAPAEVSDDEVTRGMRDEYVRDRKRLQRFYY